MTTLRDELAALLTGQVSDEPAALAHAGSDLGRIVSDPPLAVVRAASVDDVVATVRFAAARGLRLAVRGSGHGTLGQAQAGGGLVLDLRGLSVAPESGGDRVRVGAGATWAAVVDATEPTGRVFPVMPDYLPLSVGGTLSSGGVGEASFARGAQTDHVVSLDVVTGAGERVRCSAGLEPDLFDACRAGFGRCGVLVAAELRVIPAPARVRVVTTRHASAGALLAEHRRLAAEGRFDHLRGAVDADRWGRPVYTLSAAAGFDPAPPPDVAAEAVNDVDHAVFLRRLAGYEAAMRKLGVWDVPHPWAFLMLPAARAEAFLEDARATLRGPRDGRILVYLLRRSRTATPLLSLPREEESFLFGLLWNAVPATRERIEELLVTNRRLWRACAGAGGTIYPVGSVPPGAGDRERRLGDQRHAVEATRRRFDPAGILAPGVAW